jgi:hypothetical protein
MECCNISFLACFCVWKHETYITKAISISFEEAGIYTINEWKYSVISKVFGFKIHILSMKCTLLKTCNKTSSISVVFHNRWMNVFKTIWLKNYYMTLSAQLYLYKCSPILKLFLPQGLHSAGCGTMLLLTARQHYWTTYWKMDILAFKDETNA